MARHPHEPAASRPPDQNAARLRDARLRSSRASAGARPRDSPRRPAPAAFRRPRRPPTPGSGGGRSWKVLVRPTVLSLVPPPFHATMRSDTSAGPESGDHGGHRLPRLGLGRRSAVVAPYPGARRRTRSSTPSAGSLGLIDPCRIARRTPSRSWDPHRARRAQPLAPCPRTRTARQPPSPARVDREGPSGRIDLPARPLKRISVQFQR